MYETHHCQGMGDMRFSKEIVFVLVLESSDVE